MHRALVYFAGSPKLEWPMDMEPLKDSSDSPRDFSAEWLRQDPGRPGKVTGMRKMRGDIAAYRREMRAIRAAQRGDPVGFQFVYEKYKTYVFSICLRMMHDPSLAEDLTQDIFLHVWRKIGSFKGNSQFRTWLHRVSVNMVLLYFRRHKAVNISLENDALPATELKLAETVHQPDLDQHISLRRVLGQLSPRYRRVLMLHDVHGYRHEDISHLLGITSGASRSQLHKARVKMRIALGPQPGTREKLPEVELKAA